MIIFHIGFTNNYGIKYNYFHIVNRIINYNSKIGYVNLFKQDF